jgi:hypothetical protein
MPLLVCLVTIPNCYSNSRNIPHELGLTKLAKPILHQALAAATETALDSQNYDYLLELYTSRGVNQATIEEDLFRTSRLHSLSS